MEGSCGFSPFDPFCLSPNRESLGEMSACCTKILLAVVSINTVVEKILSITNIAAGLVTVSMYNPAHACISPQAPGDDQEGTKHQAFVHHWALICPEIASYLNHLQSNGFPATQKY